MRKFIKTTAQKYYASYHGIPNACWRNILFTLVNAISVGVCFFLALYFVDDLHLSMMMAGALMSSYGVGTVIGGVLSGKLCDRYSPYPILVLSSILQGVAFISLAKFNTIEPLLIILFVLGLSAYSFKTANNVFMLSHCHNNYGERLKAINISHAASNFGIGISGIAVGLLTTYGYATIFYSAGTILFLSAIYLLIFGGQSTSLIANDQTKKEIAEKATHTASKSNKRILLLALTSVFFVGIIIAQLGSTYPVYIKQSFPDLGTKAVSVLFMLDSVLIVLCQAPLSNYYSRHNTVLVMGLGALMMGLGMFVLSFSYTFTLAMISCCIWTTGEMLFLPTAQLLCYENGDNKKKGQSMGVFQSTYAISTMIGPMIGGYLYGAVSPNAMWYASFVIGIVCFTNSVMLIKSKVKRLAFSC